MILYQSKSGKQYHIAYDPPPIPLRMHDWDWAAEDYDGAPDSGDCRCGTAESYLACVEQINELENEDGT